MFSAFKCAQAQLSIFHNPTSPPSVAALKLLHAALSSPYPPNGTSRFPLKFDLEVVEHPPTADQVRTILSYLTPLSSSSLDASAPVTALLSAHPSAPAVGDRPSSAEGLVRLAQKTPAAIRWPLVVDWDAGRAAVGDVEGVRAMLEALRKVRDGEVKGEEEHRPKGWFS